MANKFREPQGSVVFGEMADEFDDWTNLEALIGSKIQVNGWRIHESKYTPGKNAATIDISPADDMLKNIGWSTEGKAVLNALSANEDNVPFECKVETRISKKNNKPYPLLVGV
jgi:hypothetical protein